MKLQRFLTLILLGLLPFTFAGQLLDPAKLLKMPTDTWPTYNGDYSGRRYSPLSQINASNLPFARDDVDVSHQCRRDERRIGSADQVDSFTSQWGSLLH